MKKICFISGSSPKFLGGTSLYQRNLINYTNTKKIDLEFTWISPGDKNRKYMFEGIRYIEIKSIKYPFLKEFDFARKVKRIILKKHFDIINTHANWGHCLKNYKNKKSQKIIHTYHGVTLPYMKIQFERFGKIKYLFYPTLPFIYLLEKYPMKKADKIICVSKKVKKDLEFLYGKRKNISIIRTGVDLSQFKKIPKNTSREKLNIKKNKIYGLYSGIGGYWNKGLDRAISIGKEMYEQNKNFRLIVIGADKSKCKKYLDNTFVEYKGLIKRKDLPKYYSAADFFFSLSRYEGGAPTLALSEAIASECLVICSKDSNPEILKHKKDCLIIDGYNSRDAKKILNLLQDEKKIKKMKKIAKEKIRYLSLEKWGKRYSKILL